MRLSLFRALPVLCAAGLLWSAMPLAAAGLEHTAETRAALPIPAAERSLQTAEASLWKTVSNENHVLEGALATRDGTLYFCDVSAQSVMAIAPDGTLRTIVRLKDMHPGGLALAEDGRLFIAALNQEKGTGTIVVLHRDGRLETILAPEAGYMPNDLVLDGRGGLYFSDFTGTYGRPVGSACYLAPDKTITPVLTGLVQANGIALSPDGTVLWVTEFGRNLLHRVELTDAVTPVLTGISVPWHFQGPAPDSMRTDAEGNVYVAIYSQGRVLAFSPSGIAIGQVLLPGRNDGFNTVSTSLAIRPGSRDMYIVTSSFRSDGRASIFMSTAFAEGR